MTRDKSEGSGWLVAAKIEEKLGNEGLMIMILRRGLECAPDSAELYCAVASYEVKHGKIDLVRFIFVRFITFIVVILKASVSLLGNVLIANYSHRQENYWKRD